MLKAYGAEVVVCPTAVAPEHPDSYYNVSDRLSQRARRLEARPVLQPEQPALPLRDHRPRDLGADRGARSPTSSAAWAPAARSAASAATSRSRTPDVQVIGADPAGSVYSGGTGRPYLVEGVGEDFWPETYDRVGRRPGHRGLRRRLVRLHPPARPRGGDARRRLVRDGGVRRSAGRARAGRHARGRRRRDRRPAAGLRARLPDQGLQRRVARAVRLRHRTRRPPTRPSARCCAASTGGCPTWCTPTRTRPSPRPWRSSRSTASPRCPWSAPSRRSWRPRSPARSPSAPCSTRCSPAPPTSPTGSRTTCRPRCRPSAPPSPPSDAVALLEDADAVLVHEDGKPVGVLTRQDLLAFLANS